MSAYIRGLVADLAVRHPTFTEAVQSLPAARNISETLQHNVLVSLLADEYDDPAAIEERNRYKWN